jgi:hypothetical protein
MIFKDKKTVKKAEKRLFYAPNEQFPKKVVYSLDQFSKIGHNSASNIYSV